MSITATAPTTDSLTLPHEPLIRHIARSLGFRHDEADDLVQEVALNLLKSAYCEEQITDALVVTVTRNTAVKMRRSRIRYQEHLARYADDGLLQREVEFEGEGHQEVWLFIDAADQPLQDVAHLLADGLDLNTIARRLGMKWDRVRRIVDALGNLLRRHGYSADAL